MPGLVEFGEDGEHAEIAALSACEWLRVIFNASSSVCGMKSHCGGGGGRPPGLLESLLLYRERHEGGACSLVVLFRFYK